MEIFSSGRSGKPINYKSEFKKYDDVSYDTTIVLHDDRPIIEWLIPSKDVRKHLEETGYQMTDFVKAHCIVRSDMSIVRKIEELKKLAASCNDEKLKKAILNYADYYIYSLKSFAYNMEEEYIYRLSVSWDEEYSDFTDVVCFYNFDDVMEYIRSCDGIKYKIEKERPIKRYEDVKECCGYYGIMLINNIVGVSSCSADDVPDPEYDPDSFADAFVPIPFPFKNGDIVYNTKSKRKGVINSNLLDDEEFVVHKDMISNMDYSDYNNLIIMDMLSVDDDMDRNWDYDHVNPLFLEYVLRDEGRKVPYDYKTEEEVLLVLSEIVKRRASIFTLEYAINNYRAYRKYKEREAYYNYSNDDPKPENPHE